MSLSLANPKPTLEEIFRGTLEQRLQKSSHAEAVTYLERLGFQFTCAAAFIDIHSTKKKHALIYANSDQIKIDIYRKAR